MARRNASPMQIIRKDGNACFVEALNSAFNIGKVQLKFVTYDTSKAQGERFTNDIDIYLDFEDYFRISHDFLNKGQILKEICENKAEADRQSQAQGKKVWTRQTIISQGGTSEKSLASQGKSRPDGKALSKILKVFCGDKLPIMFKAEQGMGESDKKGLIVPKYGNTPESYVQIGMTFDDVKEFFLTINAAVNAYFTTKALSDKYEIKLKELELENKLMRNVILEIAKAMNINVTDMINLCEQEKAALKPVYNNSQNKQAPLKNNTKQTYNQGYAPTNPSQQQGYYNQNYQPLQNQGQPQKYNYRQQPQNYGQPNNYNQSPQNDFMNPPEFNLDDNNEFFS